MRTCPQCSTECAPEHRFCPSCGFPVGALRTAAGDPLIGRTLGGSYVILENVGSGGMGRVYRAEQVSLGKTVAVKVIHPHLISDESATARFYTEARASSRLNHPNSVSVLDFGRTDDSLLYLVMEFLRGKDLAHVLWEEGPLPAARCVGILRQTLAALAEAHDLGIIHRDIKPENILIEPLRTGGDFAKVVDFGLAKVRAEVAPSVTVPGIVCGTPDYMAPEQGRGDPLDARSDLYSCGVLLFQILTGRLPFEADSPTQMVLMHMTNPVPDPRSFLNTIPEPIALCTIKALQKDAVDRYQSAVEFAEALANALADVGSTRPNARGPNGSPIAGSVPGMQQCPNCNSEVLPGVKFCSECGVRLPGVPSTGRHSLKPQPKERPSLVPRQAVTQSEPRYLAFVGREAEFAQLWAARERAGDGELVALRIAGEIGAGKHRLTEALLEKARKQGDRTVSVGPDVTWAGVPYTPLATCVRACLSLSPSDDAMAWLKQRAQSGDAAADRVVAAGFEELFTETGAAQLEGRARREAVVRAMVFAMNHCAQQAPSGLVLVVVEQLHRLDTASLAALTTLTSRPVAARAMLVGTHMPRVDPHWIRSEIVTLRGLDRENAGKALASVFNGQLPDGGLALDLAGDEILPLYIDQLARWMLEGGGQAPARLVDLVSARFERLPPRARRAVQALAVLGEATPQVLSRALGEDFDRLTSTSMRLHAWTTVDPDRIEVLSLTHPLLREVAEGSIPAGARAELHQRCADALAGEALALEARAVHAAYGEDAFQALLLLERAGDRALARGDDLGAAQLLRRGLERARREVLRGEIDEPERAMGIFGRKLGEALLRAGEVAEAEGVLREALEVVPRATAEWARLQGTLARALYTRGRTPDAVRAMDEAVKAARRLGSRQAIVDLVVARAELDLSLGNAAEAVTHLRSADEMLREPSRPMTAPHGRAAINGSGGGGGGGASHAANGGEDVTVARIRIDVLVRLARALRAAGEEVAAGEPLLEARDLADRYGLLAERARCECEGAERAELLGDLRSAALAWKRAAHFAHEAGDAVAEGSYLERQQRLGVAVAQSAGA